MTRVLFTMSSPHIYISAVSGLFSFFGPSSELSIKADECARYTLTFPSNPDSTILVVEYLPICYVHFLPIVKDNPEQL
jgi:hypothetical protein